MHVHTIKELHANWAASVMPKDAPPVQRQEMERAFYSGAFAFLTLQMADIAALPDADADKAMETVHAELETYFKLLSTIPGPRGTQRQ